MDISSVNSDLIRGNVTTIILSSLWGGDRYGYDILKEIEVKSAGQYKLKQPTLYSVLKRLEKQGLIESYLGEPDDTGGGRRRYYTLTVEGRDYLDKEKREYEFSRTILDKLVSDSKFDLESNDVPFNINELRPYTKKKNESDEDDIEKEKIVVKEVVKEKVVVKYIDSATGQEIDVNAPRPTACETNFKTDFGIQNNFHQNENQYDNNQQTNLQQTENSKLNFSQHSEQTYLNTNQQIQQSDAHQNQQKCESKEIDTSENFSKVEADTNEPKQSLIMQVLSRTQSEDKAFTNHKSSLGEGKDNHPYSPSKTLMEVFSDIEKKDNQKYAANETINKTNLSEKTAETLVSNDSKNVSTLGYENKSINDTYTQENINSIENTNINSNNNLSLQANDYVSHEHASLLDILAQKEEERELILQAQKKANEGDLKIDAVLNCENSNLQNNDVAFLSNNAQSSVTIAKTNDNNEFVSSYVLPRKKEDFSFEKEEIDYKGFLNGITAKHIENEFISRPVENNSNSRTSDAELKTRLYAKGFKVRPYTKANTTEYYSFNYILVNRLNRDSFFFVLLSYIAMIGIMWIATATKINYSVYLTFLLIGIALYAIPLGFFVANPSKRCRANFNFKLSVLNRTMLFIELSVITMLIGFFLVGADVNNIETLIAPIIVPVVLLTNLPLSSIIYYALYKSKKYHIA